MDLSLINIDEVVKENKDLKSEVRVLVTRIRKLENEIAFSTKNNYKKFVPNMGKIHSMDYKTKLDAFADISNQLAELTDGL